MQEKDQSVSMANGGGGLNNTSLTKTLISAALSSKRDVVFFDGSPTGELTSWMNASISAGNWPEKCRGYRVKSVDEMFGVFRTLVSENFDGMVVVDALGIGDPSMLPTSSECGFSIVQTSDMMSRLRSGLTTVFCGILLQIPSRVKQGNS